MVMDLSKIENNHPAPRNTPVIWWFDFAYSFRARILGQSALHLIIIVVLDEDQ